MASLRISLKKSESEEDMFVVLNTNYGQEVVSLVLLNLRQLLNGSFLCYFPIPASL